jgi:hypothetical protein
MPIVNIIMKPLCTIKEFHIFKISLSIPREGQDENLIKFRMDSRGLNITLHKYFRYFPRTER